MKTELQLRNERLAEIKSLCVLEDMDEHRVLLAQIESLSNLGIEVVHTLVRRVNCDLANYWRERADSAEAFIQGGVLQ